MSPLQRGRHSEGLLSTEEGTTYHRTSVSSVSASLTAQLLSFPFLLLILFCPPQGYCYTSSVGVHLVKLCYKHKVFGF